MTVQYLSVLLLARCVEARYRGRAAFHLAGLQGTGLATVGPMAVSVDASLAPPGSSEADHGQVRGSHGVSN